MSVKVAAIYRVSTERQVQRDGHPEETIPVQRQAVHDFIATQRGWQLVAEFAEEGVSGYKVSADDRDILQRAFHEARQGRFNVLLVYKADRLSRNSLEYPLVLARFQKLGVEVWSVKDAAGGKKLGFDNQTDKLIRFIEGWQAETESYNTSVRVSEAMTQMARRGAWTGGRVPYGYRLRERRRRKGRRDDLALEVDEHEAQVLQQMVALYLNGWGSKRIAEHLNEHGHRTKEGKLWRDAAVRRVLGNPLIAGLPAYQRTRVSSTGRSRVWKTPHLDDMIIPRDAAGQPDPIAALQIIPVDTWLQVMAIMRHNRPQAAGPSSPHPRAGRQMESDFLLTGLVRCGHCGESLVGFHHYRKKTLAGGTEARYKKLFYICNGHRQIGGGYCSGQRTYAKRKVETTVLGELEAFLRRLDLDELRDLADLDAAEAAANRTRELAHLAAEGKRQKPPTVTCGGG